MLPLIASNINKVNIFIGGKWRGEEEKAKKTEPRTYDKRIKVNVRMLRVHTGKNEQTDKICTCAKNAYKEKS